MWGLRVGLSYKPLRQTLMLGCLRICWMCCRLYWLTSIINDWPRQKAGLRYSFGCYDLVFGVISVIVI